MLSKPGRWPGPSLDAGDRAVTVLLLLGQDARRDQLPFWERVKYISFKSFEITQKMLSFGYCYCSVDLFYYQCSMPELSSVVCFLFMKNT